MNNEDNNYEIFDNNIDPENPQYLKKVIYRLRKDREYMEQSKVTLCEKIIDGKNKLVEYKQDLTTCCAQIEDINNSLTLIKKLQENKIFSGDAIMTKNSGHLPKL